MAQQARGIVKWLGCALLAAGMLSWSLPAADAGIVVASSTADWDAALASGGGVISQGHPDTSHTGIWFYSQVNTLTNPFTQTELVWDTTDKVFDAAGASPASAPEIGRDFAIAPGRGVVVNRLWNTNLPAGDFVRFQGTVSDPANGTNGAVFEVVENAITTPIDVIPLTPGTTSNFDFTVELPVNAGGNFFNFAVSGPVTGPLLGDPSDQIGFSVVMTLVPEPSSLVAIGGLAAMGLVLISLRRRKA